MINKPLCVLLDDEEGALDKLRGLIEEINLLEIERAFLSPDDLLDDIDSLESQIFFLDIEMDITGTETTGIEIAKELKNKSIIFVSGHNEYVSDVVDIKPVAFVQKPIIKHRLKKAIEKAIGELRVNKSNFIVLKTKSSKKEEIKQENITYIEADGREKKIFLSNGEILFVNNINLDDLISQLSENFLKISIKHIVNLDYTTKLISADLLGINHNGKTIELTLGNTYKESFFNAKPQLKN